MDLDLDTFLVALYTHVDDLYQEQIAAHKPHRPGRHPTVSDSEVLTLMLLTHWLRCSQRAMLRYAAQHWRAYFPQLLDQSAFNRRARDLQGVLLYLLSCVAETLSAAQSPYQVLDGVPVPLARRCRGERRHLFGLEAAIGRGGSDHEWYYGCQLLLAVTADGVITGFQLAPANTAAQWLAEALLCWRVDPQATPWGPEAFPPSHKRGGRRRGPTGPIHPRCAAGQPSSVPYLADDGFRGTVWRQHWAADYGACVLIPADIQGADLHAAKRQQAGWRQIIEIVHAALDNVFALPFPQAKTVWGLVTRIAAKLLAFNLGVWLNRWFGRSDLALATLFNS
jgi:hypothetical protein